MSQAIFDTLRVDILATGEKGVYEFRATGDKVRFEVLDLNGEKHILSGDIPLWENNEIFHAGILTNIVVPEDISILSVYPNPFNPSTNIEFSLSRNSNVFMSVYDVNGRLIKLLINDEFSPGVHSFSWDASNYPSGIYFVRLVSDDISISQKLVLMK